MKRRCLKLRVLLCKNLGWHKVNANLTYVNPRDPLQQAYSVCKYCWFKGMVDSQGNIF